MLDMYHTSIFVAFYRLVQEWSRPRQQKPRVKLTVCFGRCYIRKGIWLRKELGAMCKTCAAHAKKAEKPAKKAGAKKK